MDVFLDGLLQGAAEIGLVVLQDDDSLLGTGNLHGDGQTVYKGVGSLRHGPLVHSEVGLAFSGVGQHTLDGLASGRIELDVGGIREKIKDRWTELRSGILSEESMNEIFTECTHQVQDSVAFARDAARWPDSRHDADYDGMKQFMKERTEFLDKMIQQ